MRGSMAITIHERNTVERTGETLNRRHPLLDKAS
jgi:hypothetical protein